MTNDFNINSNIDLIPDVNYNSYFIEEEIEYNDIFDDNFKIIILSNVNTDNQNNN